jgi:hypothetical protein
MTNRSHNHAAVLSAPMRRTPGARGVAVPASIAGDKRCRFGHGPGFVEGVDV